MKRCSTALALKEMQLKTTARLYLTPVGLVIIKENATTNAGMAVEEKEPSDTVGGNAS
jgi:hypothetical protein